MTSSASFPSGGLSTTFGLNVLTVNSSSATGVGGTLGALLNNLGSSAPVDSTKVEISGLGQILAALTNFQDSLSTLLPPTQPSNSSVSNSNTAVLSATASAGASAANYTVAVTQLAQAQNLESGGYADPNNTILGTGTLTITKGTYNSGGNTFTPNGATPVVVNVAKGSVQDIANSINGANAGVVASVVQDGAGYHLLVTNAQTGASNNFKITVNDNDGNNTDNAGLSQVAFDPTAAVGSGKNLTQIQAGANAALTVNGASVISSSNTGVAIGPGLTANLSTTGSSTLGVTVDNTAVGGTAQTLVTAFNSLQSSINNLENAYGALVDNPLTAFLASSLNNQAQVTYTNPNSSLTLLSQIGITYQPPGLAAQEATNFGSGGALALNSNTLNSALSQDATGTQSLLSLAAQGFNNVANAFGDPGGSIPNLINSLQGFDLINNLVSQQPLRQSPSINELLSAQTNPTVKFTAQQLTGLQQYAQAYSLISPFALEMSILGLLTGTASNGGAGSLLSVFA
ncbi:MAG: flagellar filament capping protein FliD [Burkholderiales bacterium]|nr:flagellar filament capping protein FliD [Burkholderiales bacterium]